jgi:hypothetical protein
LAGPRRGDPWVGSLGSELVDNVSILCPLTGNVVFFPVESAASVRVLSECPPRHGKDDKLVVWKLTEEEESNMSIALPVDDPTSHRNQPWVLHILHVNTLNFCSFAYCKSQEQSQSSDSKEMAKTDDVKELLIAVPNTISSETVSYS